MPTIKIYRSHTLLHVDGISATCWRWLGYGINPIVPFCRVRADAESLPAVSQSCRGDLAHCRVEVGQAGSTGPSPCRIRIVLGGGTKQILQPCFAAEMVVLFGAQPICQAISREFDILIANHSIFADVALELATPD